MDMETNKSVDNKRKLDLNDLVDRVQKFLSELFDLETGMDREGTIVAIKNNKTMRGANVWLLMCSIAIASIGLDLNSAAVIIGAMLISPLMNPILGIGLAIGINDRDTLIISLKHFGIAIAIALLTSYIYFLITPLGELTTEILGRTKPTLLDGMVAMFGGLAGIISATRKDKSNAVPGVAIATALMPPLCVAGYGLAMGKYQIFFNSFYLFFLNSFFIAITTYIIVRLLKFPYKSFINKKEQRRTQLMIGIFSTLIMIPSILILSNLYKENVQNQEIKTFVQRYFGESNNPSQLGYELIRGDSTDQLAIKLIGNNVTQDEFVKLKKELNDNPYLTGTELHLIQDSELGLDELKKMDSKLSDFKHIADRLTLAEITKTEKELVIDSLNTYILSLTSDTIPFNSICNEAKALFPDLKTMAFANADYSNLKNQARKIPILTLKWDKSKTSSSKRRDESKIYGYVLQRAKLDTLIIVRF